MLASSASLDGAGRRRCAVNAVSFVVPDTPLKLADRYDIAGVIDWDGLPARLDGAAAVPRAGTPVLRLGLHEFVEVVFQNTEEELQSWHLDGYDFWVVGWVGLGLLSSWLLLSCAVPCQTPLPVDFFLQVRRWPVE